MRKRRCLALLIALCMCWSVYGTVTGLAFDGQGSEEEVAVPEEKHETEPKSHDDESVGGETIPNDDETHYNGEPTGQNNSSEDDSRPNQSKVPNNVDAHQEGLSTDDNTADTKETSESEDGTSEGNTEDTIESDGDPDTADVENTTEGAHTTNQDDNTSNDGENDDVSKEGDSGELSGVNTFDEISETMGFASTGAEISIDPISVVVDGVTYPDDEVILTADGIYLIWGRYAFGQGVVYSSSVGTPQTSVGDISNSSNTIYEINWTPVAMTYAIYMATSPNGPYTYVQGTTNTNWAVGLPNGTDADYYFYIVPLNGNILWQYTLYGTPSDRIHLVFGQGGSASNPGGANGNGSGGGSSAGGGGGGGGGGGSRDSESTPSSGLTVQDIAESEYSSAHGTGGGASFGGGGGGGGGRGKGPISFQNDADFVDYCIYIINHYDLNNDKGTLNEVLFNIGLIASSVYNRTTSDRQLYSDIARIMRPLDIDPFKKVDLNEFAKISDFNLFDLLKLNEEFTGLSDIIELVTDTQKQGNNIAKAIASQIISEVYGVNMFRDAIESILLSENNSNVDSVISISARRSIEDFDSATKNVITQTINDAYNSLLKKGLETFVGYNKIAVEAGKALTDTAFGAKDKANVILLMANMKKIQETAKAFAENNVEAARNGDEMAIKNLKNATILFIRANYEVQYEYSKAEDSSALSESRLEDAKNIIESISSY